MADLSDFFKELRGARILAVNPPVHDFTFFDLWAKPLGLLFLLGYLRDRGNEVSLVDCLFESRIKEGSFGRDVFLKEEIQKPLPFAQIPRRYHRFGLSGEALADRLRKEPPPDYILLTSGMTYWYGGVFEAAKIIRQVFPAVPLILGGIYPQLCPGHAKLSGADMVQTAPLTLDFHLPAMDLYRGLRYGVLVTSFGCPFRCEYCASRLLEPIYHPREGSLILEDAARQLRSPLVQDLAFYDDTLLVGKEGHFFPLLEELTRLRPEIRFHTPNGLHVREIDRKCALTLKKSGFQTLRLSLESSDPLMEEKSSHKTNREEYKAALAYLREAGFSDCQLETYILAGTPGQSVLSVENSIRFVLEQGGNPRIAEFSPVPGTASFEEAAAALPSLREEPLLSNKTVYSSYLSGNMPPLQLQRLKDLAKKT